MLIDYVLFRDKYNKFTGNVEVIRGILQQHARIRHVPNFEG
jgi:hypothetical protein